MFAPIGYMAGSFGASTDVGRVSTVIVVLVNNSLLGIGQVDADRAVFRFEFGLAR